MRELSPRRFAPCCVGLLVAFGGTCAAGAASPDLAFSDMTGAVRQLSEFRGRPVLLEFWASWCAPCRKGFPFLDTLQARYATDGLQVLALTLETDDAAVAAFVSEHPGRFLIGRDPSGEAGERFDVVAMPTAVLLDRQGLEIARFEGGTEAVHREIESALDGWFRGDSLPSGSFRRSAKTARRGLRAWERGYLADPIMSLDGDGLTRMMREHVHSSKEASAGDGGVAGGGCGCN